MTAPNDYLDDNNSYSARSVFIVFRVSSTLQNVAELGHLWGNYNEGVQIGPDSRAGNLRGYSFDGNGSAQGKYAHDGNTYGAFAQNANYSQWTYDQSHIVTVEFDGTQSITRQIIGSLVPTFAVGAHQYGGDIAEIIVYNSAINSAQKIIIENYLASKYNITLSQNDKYDYEATNNYDIAGIGRINASNFHPEAQSNILRIKNPSSLDDNDYMLFGHDNTDMTTPNTSDVPTGINNRINRIWRFDETTGAKSASGVGTVSVVFDVSGFSISSGDDLVLLIDGDGTFSTTDTQHEAGRSYDGGAGTVTFTGTDISAGNYVTLGSKNSSTALPINLISFNARLNGNIVELTWLTATETNNDYFTVDKTKDGVDFFEVAIVQGLGNSNEFINYSTIDDEPFIGLSYYRLKQTDFDGKYSYSNIVSINFINQNKNNIAIYPNPTKGLITIINFSSLAEQENLNIEVINNIGRIIEQFITRNSKFELQIKDLQKGLYFVKVTNNTETVIKKIMLE